MSSNQNTNKEIDDNIYYSLFNSAGEGLIVVDDKGEILIANPRVNEMFGYKDDELLGKTIEVLIPKKYANKHKEHRKEYHKKPKRRTMGEGMDLYGVKKNGEEFPVEISLNYMYKGDKMLVLAFITDITERKKQENELIEAERQLKELNEKLEKRVEERTQKLDEAINSLKQSNIDLQDEIKERKEAQNALEETQELYSTVAKNFPNGTISVVDKNMKYAFIEGKEFEKSDQSAKDWIGKTVIEKFGNKEGKYIENALNEVFEEKYQKVFSLKIGEEYYEFNIVPLKGKRKIVDRTLVVKENVTVRKKAEEEIRKNLEKEKELNELRSRFVSMASHEFRTPLSTILSSVSLAEKYNKPEQEEKRQKHFKKIKSSVNNLNEILNDFLSLDKINENKVESNPVEMHIGELVEEVKEEMSASAKSGQNINISGETDNKIVQDKKLLRNILINLLSNALKYSPENSSIDLEVYPDKKNDNIRIDVIDKGMGIPEEEQDMLFERFHRAKNVVNTQGTGLGLNIVKNYLDLMGGEISFKSKENQGSRFSVTLPVYGK
ncbi:MAG: ATP-binding protein, partial [Flavobacteriales bacterium]